MMNNGKQKNSNKKINARKVLLLSCVILIAVIVTFSVSLAYFGGVSGPFTADLVMRESIHIDAQVSNKKTTSVELTDYMIPGTNINATCSITLSSSPNELAKGVNGLLRIYFETTGAMANFVGIDSSVNYVDVFAKTETTDVTTALTDDDFSADPVARLVKKTVAGTDYWFLAVANTTTIADSTMLYEVLTKSYSYIKLYFRMPLKVKPTYVNENSQTVEFTNSDAGKTATFSATFTAVQAEFYDGINTTPLTTTYGNANSVGLFDI